jgi:hypothetical protein
MVIRFFWQNLYRKKMTQRCLGVNVLIQLLGVLTLTVLYMLP